MFPQKGNIYFWELKILCFIITQSICPPTLSQRLEIKTPATDFSLTSQEHTCLCDNTSQAGLKASTSQSRRFSSAAENREIFLCPWKLPAYLHCADTYLGLWPDFKCSRLPNELHVEIFTAMQPTGCCGATCDNLSQRSTKEMAGPARF